MPRISKPRLERANKRLVIRQFHAGGAPQGPKNPHTYCREIGEFRFFRQSQYLKSALRSLVISPFVVAEFSITIWFFNLDLFW